MYAITQGPIYTGHERLDDHAVLIEKAHIFGLCRRTQLPAAIPRYPLDGAILSPGFIDLQLNGCGGVMFNETREAISEATLLKMQRCNLKSGVTSFLPTLVSSSDELMLQAIEVMRGFLKKRENQALGLHLEGPYINPEKKGTHNTAYIRLPDARMIQTLCDHADVITMVTVAPERMTCSQIQQLAQAGIIVSAGHSMASALQTQQAFLSGLSMATHLYNAMPPLTGREPGLVGAIFDIPELYAGIIADGHHVAWTTLRVAKKIKKNKLILVTDGTAASGTAIDHFFFCGKKIVHQDGVCVDEQGVLSGSALTLIEALKNCVEKAGIALDEALRMITLYPAQAIGLSHRLGSIEEGKVANLTLFTPNFKVLRTIVNGQW